MHTGTSNAIDLASDPFIPRSFGSCSAVAEICSAMFLAPFRRVRRHPRFERTSPTHSSNSFPIVATTYLSSTPTPSVELIQYSASSSSRILPLPPARTPSVASSTLAHVHDPNEEQYDIIHDVLQHEDLYAILGVTRARADDSAALRRAYLARSRRCHPE